MDTARLALIRYNADDGTPCVGSGIFVDGQTVLTADHVAEGQAYRVDWAGNSREVALILRSETPDVDIALLILAEPVDALEPVSLARVDRNQLGRIEDCVAVGFPRWRKNGDERRSAQIDGIIPTGEGLESTADDGLREGLLTLVGNRAPSEHRIPAGKLAEHQEISTPWGGMSGAAVVASDLIIGVVRSFNMAGDGQSLTVTPLSALDNLPTPKRREFWRRLGVSDSSALPSIPTPRHLALAETDDYVHDVFVSYPRSGDVETWVTNRFIERFKRVLQDEVGRQNVYAGRIGVGFESKWQVSTAPELKRSRVLLAILSKQYFYKQSCLAELDSMLKREVHEGYGTTDNPNRLVYAISAHDCRSEESLPEEYRGRFEVFRFTDWAYDLDIPDWQFGMAYTDALRKLAEIVGDMIHNAPPWRRGFPISTPAAPRRLPQRRPML